MTARVRFLFLLFAFLQTQYFSFSQSSAYPINQWVKKLSDKTGPSASGIDDVLSVLKNKESSQKMAALNDIETRGNFKNNYFKSRFAVAKARSLFGFSADKRQVNELLRPALNAAYETNDDSLISEIAWTYGVSPYLAQQMEAAATYCLFAAELDEKMGKKTEAYKCWYLGIMTLFGNLTSL